MRFTDSLLSERGSESEGNLSELCVRLTAVVIAVTAVASILAVVVLGFTSGAWRLLALLPLLASVFVVVGFFRAAISLFKSSRRRVIHARLFLLLQFVMYVVVSLHFLDGSDREGERELLLGFLLGACMLFAHLAFLVIGRAAKEKVPFGIYAGIIGSALSSLVFFEAVGNLVEFLLDK